MEIRDRNFLSRPWDDFKIRIKEKVGGETSWKARQKDTNESDEEDS